MLDECWRREVREAPLAREFLRMQRIAHSGNTAESERKCVTTKTKQVKMDTAGCASHPHRQCAGRRHGAPRGYRLGVSQQRRGDGIVAGFKLYDAGNDREKRAPNRCKKRLRKALRPTVYYATTWCAYGVLRLYLLLETSLLESSRRRTTVSTHSALISHRSWRG